MGVESEAGGGVIARGELCHFGSDGATGDADFGLVFGGEVSAGLVELAAEGLDVFGEVLIGFSGDDVGVEDSCGDFFLCGVFDSDAGGVTSESDDGGRFSLAEDIFDEVFGFAPAFPEA